MPKSNAVAALPQVILPEFDVALLDAAEQRLQRAQLCAINNDADYEACALEMKADTAFARTVESGRKQMTEPLNVAVKQINARWMPAGDKAEKAREIRSKRMGEYQNAKQAEQRRLQQLADEEAQKQRRALEMRSQKADAAGNVDKAIALAQQAGMTVAAVIRTDAPKITGQSVREVWQFQIVDVTKIPREYLMPDEKKLGQFARMMKADASLAGVRFYSETRVASGV